MSTRTADPAVGLFDQTGRSLTAPLKAPRGLPEHFRFANKSSRNPAQFTSQMRPLMRTTGLSQHTIEKIFAGLPVRLTLQRVIAALRQESQSQSSQAP